jgi:hypothetical protein
MHSQSQNLLNSKYLWFVPLLGVSLHPGRDVNRYSTYGLELTSFVALLVFDDPDPRTGPVSISISRAHPLKAPRGVPIPGPTGVPIPGPTGVPIPGPGGCPFQVPGGCPFQVLGVADSGPSSAHSPRNVPGLATKEILKVLEQVLSWSYLEPGIP